MILWYSHFIDDFKSPTCPDVPGGKRKIFASNIGLYRHSVAFDLIWLDLTVLCFLSLWSPMCAWKKKCFVIIDQTCSKEHADDFFFLNSPAHWAETAENQPGSNLLRQLKLYCLKHFKIFSFDFRPRIFIFTHSIKFLQGCSAPIGCILNYGRFHEVPALGLI